MGGLIGSVSSEKNGLFTPTLLSQIMIPRIGDYDMNNTNLSTGIYGLNANMNITNNTSGIDLGALIVINGKALANGGNPIVQLAASYDNNVVKIRICWSNSWSAWRQISFA